MAKDTVHSAVEFLHLPAQCMVPNGKVVPKTVLIKQSPFVTRQRRILQNMERLALVAVLNHASTGMPVHIDEHYNVQSILVLTMNLHTSKGTNELLRNIHSSFPNPTIIVATCGANRLVSAAIPRVSQSEQGVMVVDTIETSDWTQAEKANATSLWPQVSYNSLPHNDLLAYIQATVQGISVWNLREWLGETTQIMSNSGSTQIRLVQLRELDEEIRRLHALRKNPETPLRETAQLRVKEHKLVGEAQLLAERIRSNA